MEKPDLGVFQSRDLNYVPMRDYDRERRRNSERVNLRFTPVPHLAMGGFPINFNSTRGGGGGLQPLGNNGKMTVKGFPITHI